MSPVPKSLKYYLIEKYALIMIRRIAEVLRIKPKAKTNEKTQ